MDRDTGERLIDNTQHPASVIQNTRVPHRTQAVTLSSTERDGWNKKNKMLRC